MIYDDPRVSHTSVLTTDAKSSNPDTTCPFQSRIQSRMLSILVTGSDSVGVAYALFSSNMHAWSTYHTLGGCLWCICHEQLHHLPQGCGKMTHIPTALWGSAEANIRHPLFWCGRTTVCETLYI